MRRPGLAIIAALLALAAALGVLVSRQTPATLANPAKPAPHAVDKPRADTPVTDVRTALPPSDLPISASLPALRAAIMQGNPSAACRLAWTIDRCAGAASLKSDLATLERLPKTASLTEAIAKRRTQLEKTTKTCDIAPPDDLVAWRLMLDAALQGHVPSMSHFTSRGLLRDGKGQWDLDALGAYRDHAYDFLRRAAEAGDAASVENLGVELMTPGAGTRAVPFDPVRGLAYLKALSARAAPAYRTRLESTSAELSLNAKMSNSDIARADAMAASLLSPAALARLDNVSRPQSGDEENRCD